MRSATHKVFDRIRAHMDAAAGYPHLTDEQIQEGAQRLARAARSAGLTGAEAMENARRFCAAVNASCVSIRRRAP